MGQGERTEQATPRRRSRARREGNFPSSPLFVSTVQFAVAVGLLAAAGEDLLGAAHGVLREGLQAAFREVSIAAVADAARSLGWRAARALFENLGLLLGVTLAAQLAVTRLGVSAARLQPQWSRLHPASRLSSAWTQNRTAFLQALVLLPFAGVITAWQLSVHGPDYLQLLFTGARAGAARVASGAADLLRYGSYLFLAAGCIDLWRQWRRYDTQLRMTKQEVRDEAKEQEGNPETKARVRRLQRDFARRRMMQQVPKATAVIVNPTHYAVALRYQAGEAGAPRVVAKGKNFLARRIRELAVRSGVPIVENAPLAQALYRSADVGQEIPPALYRAVAEILAYIMRLLHGRLPG